MEPISAIALTLLKKFWPYILVAVVIGGALTYVKVLQTERDHYKEKVVQVQAAYDKAVVEAKQREGTLKAKAEKQTQNFNDIYLAEQAEKKAIQTEKDRLYAENLRQNGQLFRLRLDLATVRLFNESKHSDSPKSEDTPATVTRHDGEATTASDVTGVELFKAIKINDDNHLACIKVVEKWQKFWLGYVEIVKESNK